MVAWTTRGCGMDSERNVVLALKQLGCSQKELARKLGVSESQISKWKKGEHMSSDMEDKIGELLGVKGYDLHLVALAGSKEALAKWMRLFQYLAVMAEQNSETGYDTAPIVDFTEWSIPRQTLEVLLRLTAKEQIAFPAELDYDYEAADDDSGHDVLDKHELARLIYAMYAAFVNVWAFYMAYMEPHVVDEAVQKDVGDDYPMEIENHWLFLLAVSKLDLSYPGFEDLRREMRKEWLDIVQTVKEACVKHKRPLEAELMDMLQDSDDDLGQTAEAKAMGFTAGASHPDIYMAELLDGMRMIHKVLPAIMRRVGVTENDLRDPDEAV